MLVDAPQARQHEVVPLSAAEARRLIQAAQQDRMQARWLVGLALGLRQGEALGLWWEDIDLIAGLLRVRRALQRQRGGGRARDRVAVLLRRGGVQPHLAHGRPVSPACLAATQPRTCYPTPQTRPAEGCKGAARHVNQAPGLGAGVLNDRCEHCGKTVPGPYIK